MSFLSEIISLFRPRRSASSRDAPEDPREPDCPRTPKNEWKSRSSEIQDFRSPTLGISRSPISRAKKWTFPTLDPIVNVPIVQVSKEKEDLMSFSEEPIVAAAAAVHVVPVVAEEIAVPVMPAPIVMEAIPSVSNELEKLRIEFSVKHQDSPAVFSSPMARSAKQFLSSPALWKTISNSPMIDSPMPSSNHASDPLLQNWNSPSARRNLFTRQESASAA